jgi:MoxR-like ATPase
MMDGGTIEPRLNAAALRLAAARASVCNVIIGQTEVVDLTLAAILSGGHALLTGVPGLGKTRLVETLGIVLGLGMRRVQFTPDLMPSDILGSEVLDETPEGRKFRFIPGPVFTELLMADEINRASPRTQSALLQAMAEGAVAVAGENRKVPSPFHVLATQNPIEQEGTYPLPEAQLDRFLLDIRIDYPAAADERAMLLATTGVAQLRPSPVLSAETLLDAQYLVRAMPVGSKVVDGIMHLVRGARPETASWPGLKSQLAWGPGPRAAQALMLASRARALLDGRLAPSLDDIAALAAPALRHRMALNFSARAEGVDLDAIIARLAAAL